MARTIRLEIITPEAVVFNEEVGFFSLRSVDGDLGILPRHAPLFTLLQPCILKCEQGDQEDYIAVMGGFLEVSNDKATVLTDSAEQASDIDVLRAKKAKERAEAAMTEKREHADTVTIEASLRRALLRLRAAELIKRRRGIVHPPPTP